MPNSRTKEKNSKPGFNPANKPVNISGSYTFLHKHVLEIIPQRMAGAWWLPSGICCFQKNCFITSQLSKLCKLPEHREQTKYILNSNCWSEYLNLHSTFNYVRDPHSRIQEFQGSTNIQKLCSWRFIVNLASHSLGNTLKFPEALWTTKNTEGWCDR